MTDLRCPQQTSRTCPRAGVNEVRKTGDAREDALRHSSSTNRNAELLFEADGEFEHIQGIETEAAANERLVVGNLIRIEKVEPEHLGDEMLQVRQQQASIWAMIFHLETVTPNASNIYGI